MDRRDRLEALVPNSGWQQSAFADTEALRKLSVASAMGPK